MTCVYTTNPSQPPKQQLGRVQEFREPQHSTSVDTSSSISRASTVPSHVSQSLADSLTSALTSVTQPSVRDVESLKSRIRQLEDQLSKVTQRSTQSPVLTSNPNIEITTTTSNIAGTFSVHYESHQPQVIARSVTHKSRLFGQSHWINGAILVGFFPHSHFSTQMSGINSH